MSLFRRGFTLIEMLVVMAIVALLLSLSLPRYFGSLDKAKDVVLKENLQVVRISIDRFYADKGRYPETLDELVKQRYIRELPYDPVTDSTQTWLLHPSRQENARGVYDISSGAVGETKDGKLYASF